ncbi:MAG TPA: PhzF family phenazine biosynthesis protein [Solirubrobacterales bacterium]|nr:PhzF family phenazine biosynthesis protein [Solirubrobacterales bacterium]
MPTLDVLRVFVNDDGEWGNPLGVFLDGGQVRESKRQGVAAALGFSETVFVEDRAGGRLRIHTPTVELPFAGHPTVGAAWLLAREGSPVQTLQIPAGEVGVRNEGEDAYVVARPEWAPRFEYRQLTTPAEIRDVDPAAVDVNTYAWAWVDEDAGTIRARCFAPELGIAEDDATGSAAIALCTRLGRRIAIHQGHGSVLQCRPLGDGTVELGGRTRLVESRPYREPDL